MLYVKNIKIVNVIKKLIINLFIQKNVVTHKFQKNNFAIKNGTFFSPY